MKRFMVHAAAALTLSALCGISALSASAQSLYFNDNGVIKSISGGGTIAPLATVAGAQGFAFSDSGRSIFVATGTGISKVSVAGGAVASFATGLNDAKKVATDSSGNLYTTDGFDLVRYNLAGTRTVIATLPAAAQALGTIGVGNGIAVDSARGFAYVGGARGSSQAIYRVNLGTNVFDAAAIGTFGNVNDLVLDQPNDALYIANFRNNNVVRRTSISTTGQTEAFIDNSLSDFPDNNVQRVAFNNGTVYASLAGSSAGATDGKIISKAIGTPSGSASTVNFNNIGSPTYIAFAAVPAPSSVVVMAMGGLMPLVAFARRRRAAK